MLTYQHDLGIRHSGAIQQQGKVDDGLGLDQPATMMDAVRRLGSGMAMTGSRRITRQRSVTLAVDAGSTPWPGVYRRPRGVLPIND